MYHPEYKRALQLLSEAHKHYLKTLDINKKDVRLALYYLSGGAITQANFAVQAWSNGDLNTPYRVKRFIDEAKMLIICMIAINDRDRFVQRFFMDEIVTIDPKKYRREIMVATGMNDKTFDEWVENDIALRHGFSKGVHVTYKSVAYNTNIDTGEFDYNGRHLAFHPIDGFDFAHFIIIPTIDCVTTSSGVFGVSSNDLKEIYNIRETIQKIAMDKFRTRGFKV